MESLAIDGVITVHGPNPHLKRPRARSLLLFDSPFSSLVPDSSLSLGLETKRLIVSTYHTIVKLELAFSNLDAKSCTLEQHRAMGTFPNPVSSEKKLLFEDEQSQMDEILQNVSSAFLVQRKKSETLTQKISVEDGLLKNFESSRDSQVMHTVPEDFENILL